MALRGLCLENFFPSTVINHFVLIVHACDRSLAAGRESKKSEAKSRFHGTGPSFFELSITLSLRFSYPPPPLQFSLAYNRYLKERFVDQLAEPVREFHFVNGAADPGAECGRLAKLLTNAVEVDVAFIGIGVCHLNLSHCKPHVGPRQSKFKHNFDL